MTRSKWGQSDVYFFCSSSVWQFLQSIFQLEWPDFSLCNAGLRLIFSYVGIFLRCQGDNFSHFNYGSNSKNQTSPIDKKQFVVIACLCAHAIMGLLSISDRINHFYSVSCNRLQWKSVGSPKKEGIFYYFFISLTSKFIFWITFNSDSLEN